MRDLNGIGSTAGDAARVSAPNHALHLLLTVFTCGLWLPVWLIITLVNRRSFRPGWPRPDFRGFVSAHPALSAFGAFALLVAIIADWKAVAGIAIIAAIVAGLVTPVMLVVRSAQRRREEMAAIAARADDQHQAVLRGDDQWGVFGQKPPVEFGEDSDWSPPSTLSKPDRKWMIAGCGIAAAAVLFAALVTVNARSADRPSGPVPAPTITHTRAPIAPTHQALPAPSLTFPALPFPFPLPSTSTVPTTPTGVPAQIGQQAADGQLMFVVTSFDRSKTAGNPVIPFMQATAKGIFVNAHVTITNRGTQPAVFFASDQKFKVGGLVFNVDPAAALWTFTTAVPVSPGVSVPVTLSFDVPADTPRGGTLELHVSSTSRGVDVVEPN